MFRDLMLHRPMLQVHVIIANTLWCFPTQEQSLFQAVFQTHDQEREPWAKTVWGKGLEERKDDGETDGETVLLYAREEGELPAQ